MFERVSSLRHDVRDEGTAEISVIELIAELPVELREELIVIFGRFTQIDAVISEESMILIVGQKTCEYRERCGMVAVWPTQGVSSSHKSLFTRVPFLPLRGLSYDWNSRKIYFKSRGF